MPEATASRGSASSPAQPAERPIKDRGAAENLPTSKRSGAAMAPPETVRRSDTSASLAVSKTSAMAGARTPGGKSKPPTRSPASAARRPATSASALSHRSLASVSASEDERRPAAASATARWTSSMMLSPGRTAEKKSGGVTSTPTVRKSLSGAGAASPRTPGPRTPGPTPRASTTTGPSSARAGTARLGGPTSGATTDVRKRLSTAGATATAFRPATQTPLQPEAAADAARTVDDLMSKLAQRDTEIESLKSQISSFEEVIIDLREQADTGLSQEHASEGQPQEERREYIASLKSEHESALRTLEAELSETTFKLGATENELAEAVRTIKKGEAALETSRKSFDALQVETEESRRISEGNLQKVLHDHAAQTEKLQASVDNQGEPEAALAKLNSKHESVTADLQRKIDELTASKAALESATVDTRPQEQKGNLDDSEAAVEKAKIEMEKDTGRELRDALAERDTELASAHEAMTSMQRQVNDIQAAIAERDGEISKLKTMHDERMKQISQDYENEIESLRDDAFFKRKFQELEKQHDDLKTSATEAANDYAKALTASKEEHLLIVRALASKELEYQHDLDVRHESHAKELKSVQNSAFAANEAHAKELESLKAQQAEELRMITEEREAPISRHLEDLRISHEQVINELGKTKSEEKEKMLAIHASELATAKAACDGLHASELAKLQEKLDEARTELEKAQSANAEALEASSRDIHENHAAEVEKLIIMHTETMESLKAEGAEAKKDLAELAAAQTKAIEDVMAEYRNKNTTFEDELSQQTAANVDLRAALEAAQEALATAQVEIQEFSRQLAQEKMERMTALAELDAAKNVKSDTAAMNDLKAELAATKKSLEESVSTAKTELQAKQNDLDSAKNDLSDIQNKLVNAIESLGCAQKSLKAYRAKAEAKHKTAQADYHNLNDSMAALVEEANSKAKEFEIKVEDLTRTVGDGEKMAAELQAQLKIRDAELAEAKARAATAKSKGSASSRDADAEKHENGAAATDDMPESEDDDDHSSVALALLSKLKLTAKQVDALDREMRDRNLQLLSSITDVKPSG